MGSRSAPVLIAVILWSAVLAADDHTVLFDHDVHFASFKTFTLHDGPIASRRPELNNAIVIKKLTDAIRTALVAQGLKETANAGDLLVEYSVTSADFGIGPFGRANQINTGRGRRGAPDMLGAAYTDGTLVVDLKAGEPRALVWRGVYNDTGKKTAKLAEALPADAVTLLAGYPPRKK